MPFFEVLHFARENSVKLEAEPLVGDRDFEFVIRRLTDGKTFPFVIKLDNDTERVRSKQDTESIEGKRCGYHTHPSRFAAHDPQRDLLLLHTTRSELHLRKILDAAAVKTQPQRRVFVGVERNRFRSANPFNVSA